MNKLTSKFSLAICLLLCCLPVFSNGKDAKPDNWHIDTQRSKAIFTIKHWGVMSVTGTISGIAGSVRQVGGDLSSALVKASLSLKTINTNNKKRDKHLRSADYFDLVKYPFIEFISTSVKKTKDNKWIMAGNLEIHGTVKPIDLILDFKSPNALNKNKKQIRSIRATGALNRQDFGISGGGMLIGDNVDIVLDIQLNGQISP